MGYNLLLNGVSWGYNPLTNQLLTSSGHPSNFFSGKSYLVHGSDHKLAFYLIGWKLLLFALQVS